MDPLRCHQIEIWIPGINRDLIDSLLIAKHEAASDNSEGEDLEEFDDVYLIQTVADIFFGNTRKQFYRNFFLFLCNFNEI